MTTSDAQTVETNGPEETFGVARDLGRQLAAGQADGSPVLLVLLLVLPWILYSHQAESAQAQPDTMCVSSTPKATRLHLLVAKVC